MIAVDSSAIVAIAEKETEAALFATKIELVGRSVISAPNYLEASMVMEGRHGASGPAIFDSVISRLRVFGLEVISFDQLLADRAREAFRLYGKGRHPAGLNFGDCFSWALATELDVPLLYKGRDFDKTGVARA